MDFKDFYKILGVEPSATAEEIKRAYKKLARKYHPDVSSEPDAQAHFQDVSDAYDNLKNEEKRAEYDQLRAYVKGDGQRFADNLDPNLSFDDLLQSLFGRGGGPFEGFGRGADVHAAFSQTRGSGGQRSADGPFGGFPQADAKHHLEITLEEAFAGGKRQLRIQDQQAERVINVTIPAGITAGKQLRLAGQGNPDVGGTSSDLYLEICIAPHPVFQVDGQNITTTLKLTPWEAALGASIDVPTLGGEVSLKIPANSQSGRKLRLKGRGLGSGDQYVILEIVNPDVATPSQRQAYEKLGEQFSFNPRSE